MTEEVCRYRSPEGMVCPHSALHHGLCFWHDAEQIKTEPDLIPNLETRARTDLPMQGFSLRNATLTDVNLVHHGSKGGYDLSHSDFYRADMRLAHLFNANLKGASLMKADLRRANLHCANLEGANLLGTRLEEARLDNVHWGHYVMQENLARSATKKAEQLDYFEQAEEVYRNLRRVLETEGLFEQAGYFFRREMVMRRMQMPLLSTPRLISKLVDLFCGYGERPLRVISFSIALILGFALLFFINGVTDRDQLLQLSFSASLQDNLYAFTNCLYFSVVTFTTLGYGDITPVGINRLFAATEAFLGSFTLALFVVVFVKKMTR